MRRVVIIPVLLGFLNGCDSRSSGETVPNAASEVTACELFVEDDVERKLVYRFSQVNDGHACDVDNRSSVIIPSSSRCGQFPTEIFSSVRPLSHGQAADRLRTCNVVLSEAAPSGLFSTTVALDSGQSNVGGVTNFQKALTDIAMRVPLSATYFTGATDFYCFQYEDASVFRRHLEEVISELPTAVSVEHLDGGVCASLMRRRFG